MMTQARVRATLEFNILFTIETDASNTTIGAVLLQSSRPIAFFSKQLCPRLQRASTYVHELHAITNTVRKWRHYLLGHSFIILTHHQSLKDLMSQVIQTLEQQVYLSKLLGFDYTIQYKFGSSNVVTDALARIPKTPALQILLSIPNPLFMEQLRQASQANPTYQEIFH